MESTDTKTISFWGVFWIDASSHERIKQTFAQIAKFGEVKPNQNAAMHWLSNLGEGWLLIIDNADDTSIDLEQYFPKGNRGCVLVTTRNPAHKIHGNVGPGYFAFQEMEGDDANALLLRAAHQPEPWDADSSSWAARRTRLNSATRVSLRSGLNLNRFERNATNTTFPERSSANSDSILA